MRSLLVSICLVPFLFTPGLAQEKLINRATELLPKINGEIALPGLKEPVEVLRDKWGVPHIYAKNADDLFFSQGFVAAQDRLFQLDLWRRMAVGEMAEVLGSDAIEADTFARLVRYRGDMKAEWTSYSPDTKQIATSFTNGINAYIKHAEQRFPIEFEILGHQPKLWQPEDILGRMSGIIMSRNFTDEVVRARLISKLGIEKVRKLMPTDPPRDFAPAPGLDLKGIDQRIVKGYQAATKALSFVPSKTESNNWVVSGALSASGKPMLASDPHRAIALPSLRYLVHLNAPGWNVIGAGEPALPGVALGHNERIAWGITIVGTDQTDIFVEEVNPLQPTHYKVGGEWKPIEVVEEKLNVKAEGKHRQVLLQMEFTRNGPVIFRDNQKHLAYALKWAGSEPGGAAYLGSLAVGRANNHQEFLKALAAYKLPSLNFVYADLDGNIGWVANALTPIRPKHDGLLPVPGNAGYEWTGFRAVKDLPQSFNPKSGWLATANHNILPKGYPHEISFEFAAPYRFQRIEQSLTQDKKFTLADFQTLQHDHTSIPGIRLAKLLANVKFDDPIVAKYAKIMSSWDGVLSRDSQAGPIYAYWLPELQQAVYQRHVRPTALAKEVAAKSGLPTMLKALENPDQEWFGPRRATARDLALRDSFTKAVAHVQKRFPKIEEMRWGVMHTVTFRHALASVDPLYGKTLNIGPFERTGDGNSPNNTRYDEKFQQIHGATYRHLFDLADWDKGLATSAPGQSAQFGSPHYADLAPLWAEGRYFPLAYSRKKVEEVTQNRLLLRPGS